MGPLLWLSRLLAEIPTSDGTQKSCSFKWITSYCRHCQSLPPWKMSSDKAKYVFSPLGLGGLSLNARPGHPCCWECSACQAPRTHGRGTAWLPWALLTAAELRTPSSGIVAPLSPPPLLFSPTRKTRFVMILIQALSYMCAPNRPSSNGLKHHHLTHLYIPPTGPLHLYTTPNKVFSQILTKYSYLTLLGSCSEGSKSAFCHFQVS